MASDGMNRRTFGWPSAIAITLYVMTHAGLLHADESGKGPTADRMLSSKLDLLDRLVHEERLVIRIRESNDVEARRMLDDARAMWEQAEIRYEAGSHAMASELVSRGMATLSAVSRRIEDSERRDRNARLQYEKLRKRVLSFTEAFQRVVMEKPDEPVAGLMDDGRVSELLHKAETFAVNGDYARANEQAAAAVTIVEVALVRARENDTLLHELSFATAMEEYEYEKQRNRSYRLLMDILEREKADDGEALQRVRSAVLENDSIRERADDLVAQGNVDEAIRVLETGTEQLARTLRDSGLVF